MLARPEIDFDSPEAMKDSYGGYLSIPNLTATHGTESRLFFSGAARRDDETSRLAKIAKPTRLKLEPAIDTAAVACCTIRPPAGPLFDLGNHRALRVNNRLPLPDFPWLHAVFL
jgi:hypothetical protein